MNYYRLFNKYQTMEKTIMVIEAALGTIQILEKVVIKELKTEKLKKRKIQSMFNSFFCTLFNKKPSIISNTEQFQRIRFTLNNKLNIKQYVYLHFMLH